MKTIVSVIVAILITAGGTTYLFKRAPKKVAPTYVRIEKPQVGHLIEAINAPGRVDAKRKVQISAKVSAKITELPFKEGDQVTKGQPDAMPPLPASVVVRLDSTDLETDLRSIQANREGQLARIKITELSIQNRQENINTQRIQIEQTQLELKRKIPLLASGDISQTVIDDLEFSLKRQQSALISAQNDLASAKLQRQAEDHDLKATDERIKRAKENISYTVITSPIDGTVTRINNEVGEIVIGTINMQGSFIMEVADFSKMVMIARIDETDINKVKMGQKAHINIHTWGEMKFTGTVDSVALAKTSQQIGGANYYEAEILLDDTDQQLFSGLNADADIEIVNHADIIKVPRQAVLSREIESLPTKIKKDNALIDENKTFATVVYRVINGKTVVTPVKIGVSDNTHTIILAGVTADDPIVTKPFKVLEKLKHDQAVVNEDDKDKKEKEGKEDNARSEVDKK